MPPSLSVSSAVQGALGGARQALDAEVRAAGEALLARHRRPGLRLRFRSHVGPAVVRRAPCSALVARSISPPRGG